MLELATLHGDRFIGSRFKPAIDACAPAAISGPLFDVERRNRIFEKLAEQRATKISRKWGVWAADFELKANALRPIQWIVANNPSLAARALASGVQASILAECEADGRAIESESELARKCGVTRAAVREALRGLELAGLVLSEPRGRSHGIELAGATISRT